MIWVGAVQVAASVLELFPPRGIIRLLPAEHTELGRLKMERLVAEEYILDTIQFFEADRVECAKRLAKGTALSVEPVDSISVPIVLLFSRLECVNRSVCPVSERVGGECECRPSAPQQA